MFRMRKKVGKENVDVKQRSMTHLIILILRYVIDFDMHARAGIYFFL